jgi:DNA-binding NarL/FixJ family response regulator
MYLNSLKTLEAAPKVKEYSLKTWSNVDVAEAIESVMNGIDYFSKEAQPE